MIARGWIYYITKQGSHHVSWLVIKSFHRRLYGM